MKRLVYFISSLLLAFVPKLTHAQFQLFPGEASGANDFRIYIQQVVNPNLVNLRLPEFPKIDIALGGCLYTTNNPAGKTGAKCLDTTQTQCESIKREGSPAPQFNKDQRCSALCPENDVDGFCKNAQKKPTISEDERIVKAAYCGQFSTSIDVVQQRVSDYTRYDEQENCNRYCSSRPLGQTSDGVEFICSSEYVRGEFVNGRQFPSRRNCL